MDPNISQELRDHLRIVERMLHLIEQLGHEPGACNPELVRGYAIRALIALRAAEAKLAGPSTT